MQIDMTYTDKCKHLLPCGYCDKKGAKCNVFYDQLNSQSIDNSTKITIDDLVLRQPNTSTFTNSPHAHDWRCISMSTNSATYECAICHQTKTEYTSIT